MIAFVFQIQLGGFYVYVGHIRYMKSQAGASIWVIIGVVVGVIVLVIVILVVVIVCCRKRKVKKPGRPTITVKKENAYVSKSCFGQATPSSPPPLPSWQSRPHQINICSLAALSIIRPP